MEKARKDKEDIIDHLQEEEKKKKKELKQLDAELRDSTAKKEAQIKELSEELNAEKESAADKVEALTEQIEHVERQVDSLKHFEQIKSGMDAELKRLKETLTREQIKHKVRV